MRVRVTSTAAGIATVAVLLLLITACGSATQTVPIPRETAAEALRSKLEGTGLKVTWLSTSQRSDFFDSDVRRATLQIGDARGSLINVYRFPTDEDAAVDAGRVSPGGSEVPADGGVAMVSWSGRPHFFRQGRLIALFCESGSMRPTQRDRVILAALEEVMGPQFAGASHE